MVPDPRFGFLFRIHVSSGIDCFPATVDETVEKLKLFIHIQLSNVHTICHFEAKREILMIVREHQISPASRYDKITMRHYTGILKFLADPQQHFYGQTGSNSLTINNR